MSSVPSNLEKIQHENLQTSAKNLEDTYIIIEKLIRKTYENNDMDANSSLRNTKVEISRIISEINSKGLSNFYDNRGKLEDFYDKENKFVEISITFLNFAHDQLTSQNSIDIFALENYVRQFKDTFNNRIKVNKELLDEFNAMQTKEAEESDNISKSGTTLDKKEDLNNQKIMGITCTDEYKPVDKTGYAEELEASTISKIYNYFNILELKYSSYKPEISNNGDYIGDKKWNFEISDKRITGKVKDGLFKNPLVFDTYWSPIDNVKDLINFVQSKANSVPNNQFMSICLVNSQWNNEIKDWVQKYMHLRLMIYLYELETDYLVLNENIGNVKDLCIWHNADKEVEVLEERIKPLVEEMEYFSAENISEITGLNINGAQRFLKELINRNVIIDLGFDSSMYAKSKR
jgi:hypothetical protein